MACAECAAGYAVVTASEGASFTPSVLNAEESARAVRQLYCHNVRASLLPLDCCFVAFFSDCRPFPLTSAFVSLLLVSATEVSCALANVLGYSRLMISATETSLDNAVAWVWLSATAWLSRVRGPFSGSCAGLEM